MKTIGKFKIKDSFNITGRGLVAIGDIIEGKVKIGSVVTFNTGSENVTPKVGGVEMGDKRSTGECFVGLLFVYKDENERRRYESLKLNEQTVDVMAEE
jgi:translation elongation factor EF-Tu-like GTPase